MLYTERDYSTYATDDKGETELLANFVAKITEQTKYVDGRSSQTMLTIKGYQKNPDESPDNDPAPIELPACTIDAADFAGMTWVVPAWGIQAIIQPGAGVKEDLRTAIQMKSTPVNKTVYRSIGWQQIDGQKAYLHATGAIKGKKNDKTVEVALPPELRRYDLSTDVPAKQGIQATLALADSFPPQIIWPLIAGTFAPLYGPVDFGIHLTGRTGTYKSEVMSLLQSHYGAEMDARHLPGSWSSTANALEAQAFCARNAPFVIDDFVPNGTSWQIRAYQATAEKIIRAQGNQSGRARLTDTSNLQETMYPRGIVLSTGEDTPDGHSVRARMLILEMSPGDIDVKQLTKAQDARAKYPATTVALIQDLINNPVDITPTANKYRADLANIGHSRTPGMLAKLITVIQHALDAFARMKAITPQQARTYTRQAIDAINAAGERQQSYMEETDPTDIFLAAIRQIFAAGLGHARSTTGGVPLEPHTLGWTEEETNGSVPMWKSRGPLIGWADWNNKELLIEANAGYSLIKKVAGSEINLTKQTMIKRLKDAGLLTRSDDARQRNTVRVKIDHHPRQVIALCLAETLDTEEAPSDEPTEEEIPA